LNFKAFGLGVSRMGGVLRHGGVPGAGAARDRVADPAREDHLALVAGVDETLHLSSRGLVLVFAVSDRC
jgi:hypothetical protein